MASRLIETMKNGGARRISRLLYEDAYAEISAWLPDYDLDDISEQLDAPSGPNNTVAMKLLAIFDDRLDELLKAGMVGTLPFDTSVSEVYTSGHFEKHEITYDPHVDPYFDRIPLICVETQHGALALASAGRVEKYFRQSKPMRIYLLTEDELDPPNKKLFDLLNGADPNSIRRYQLDKSGHLTEIQNYATSPTM